MKKKNKGVWIIPILTIICVGMIAFFSNLKQNEKTLFNVYSIPDKNQSAEDDTEEEQIETVNSYPYYGMREEDLNHCLLGKPMIISECSDFDRLEPENRKKYYHFGYSGYGNNSGTIIVRYRLYNDQDDEYLDLPPDKGYVASGYFIDGNGVEYRITSDYSSGISKVEKEDTEATTEKKKKNGGRLLPGSKDDGKGSSSSSSAARHKDTSSATTEFDPDDHDIDAYYEDNKDEFESYDDAYDAFEDDRDAWDDY